MTGPVAATGHQPVILVAAALAGIGLSFAYGLHTLFALLAFIS